jgi:hypothetical protein
MPAGDVIFERLQAATDAELAAVARALNETLGDVRVENVDMLSRELRADAGSILGNIGRNDHDLPYLEILDDVASKAANLAGWPKPKLDGVDAEGVENYIVRAFSFVAEKETASKDAVTKAQRDAERELGRESPDAKAPGAGSGAARAAAIAASYLLRTNPIMATASFGMMAVFGLAWLAGPAMRRVTPAVLTLIHIRHRQAAEVALGGAS